MLPMSERLSPKTISWLYGPAEAAEARLKLAATIAMIKHRPCLTARPASVACIRECMGSVYQPDCEAASRGLDPGGRVWRQKTLEKEPAMHHNRMQSANR